MPDVSFTNLLVVAAIAVLAPLTVGFAPRLRIPAVVLEITGGIIAGPSGFGWVRVDLPVQILALFGLAFLLFLAGLEIDVHRLRGRLLRFAVPSWAPSWPGPSSAWSTATPARTRTSGSSWRRSATDPWCRCSSWPAGSG